MNLTEADLAEAVATELDKTGPTDDNYAHALDVIVALERLGYRIVANVRKDAQ